MNSVIALLVGLLVAAEPVVVPPVLEGALPQVRIAARRDVIRTVTVRFTVGAAGEVSDATVVEGAGEPWDRAALEAISRARFTPGSRDGEPYPFQLTTQIPVGTREVVYDARPRRPSEETPRSPEGISGRVIERGTRRALAGLPVLLGEAGEREVLTDAAGRFVFPDLALGEYRLSITGFDHEPLERTVRAPASLTLRLTPAPNQSYRTLVRSSPTDSARIRVPVERAREVPGSNGDPIKVVESLPGVARPAGAGPATGQLSVRGSAPEDTRFYLDGLPLFQLYHFGGLYSVVQDEWIREVDFRPAGGTPEYGDATGGFLGVTLADIPNDGVHGHFDVNVYHAAVLVTAPISNEWTVGAALRRSYFDAILGAIVDEDDGLSFSVAPRYYDYQVRADWRPSQETSLRLVALGSDDLLSLVLSQPSGEQPESGFRLRRFFHQLQGSLSQALSNDLTLTAGLATSYQQLEIRPADNALTITFDPLTAKTDIDWRASKRLRLRGGVLAEVSRYNVELDVPRPTKEGQVQLPSEAREIFTATEDGFLGQLGLWSELNWRLLPELSVIGGLRLTAWLGTFDEVAPDARLTVAWEAGERTRLSLSAGVSHQAAQPDEWAETIGNPDLGPERAWSASVGISQRISDALSVDLQGFYKALEDLVSPTGDLQGVPYDNAATGTIFGAELLVRLSAGWIDGWLAYTVSRSQRLDRPGEIERPFSFDQTHVLALVTGVNLGANWRFGLRLRYATGNPFTPLEAAYYDAGSDVWVPRAAAATLSRRVADILELDLRVSKSWIFDSWRLQLYLELQNATNADIIEAVGYSDDYRSRDDINGLPIRPSFGIRAEF